MFETTCDHHDCSEKVCGGMHGNSVFAKSRQSVVCVDEKCNCVCDKYIIEEV